MLLVMIEERFDQVRRNCDDLRHDLPGQNRKHNNVGNNAAPIALISKGDRFEDLTSGVTGRSWNIAHGPIDDADIRTPKRDHDLTGAARIA